MTAGPGPLQAVAPTLADRALPLELRQEIEVAFRRTVELATQDRQLDFCKDHGTGRIVVRVRDLDGELIRVIASTEALDVMAGAELH